jgi:acetyl-CoA acetyltransferase
MAEYHITNEQFARVAVENRRWAVDHPSAMYRDRGLLTVDDVLASPMVASPLHLYDCAPWFPGAIAGAVVICDEDVAADMEVDPIYLLGFGQCTTHRNLSGRLEVLERPPFFCNPSLTTTGISAAAKQAYTMCGLQPTDIDVIESSGPFSFFLLRVLEELGFCGPGEAGAMVEAGGIDRYGGLPFNTFGGMLSYGQTAQAMYPLFEAVEQLRGTAKNRQVEGCQVALVHGHGGPMNSQSVLIISNRAA